MTEEESPQEEEVPEDQYIDPKYDLSLYSYPEGFEPQLIPSRDVVRLVRATKYIVDDDGEPIEYSSLAEALEAANTIIEGEQ